MAGPKKNDGPEQLGGLVEVVLGKYGLRDRVRENEVFLHWEEAVGTEVASNSRIVSIADGILVVATRDNVWMQELSLLRKSIAEELNRLMGFEAVRELRFKIGGIDKPGKKAGGKGPTRKKSKPENLRVSQKVEKEIQKHLEGIEDEELRAALRNMMVRGFKREQSREP